MSYQTEYIIPFKSIKENSLLVEIQSENEITGVTELKGGSTPFTVSIDNEEFLYTPTRFSEATLCIVGYDYLQKLYSTNYQQYRVNLKRNGIIVWTGFIKPELYTQDYSSENFELEIECVSAMSILENIDYKSENETLQFISIFDLIKKCISASKGDYQAIYIPHVYAKNKDNHSIHTNVLSQMTISEQNFFDEDDKPMKLSEVLEEICKFLNWTCVDWKGELYFFDADHKYQYFKYAPDFSTYIMVDSNKMTVQDIGFAGDNHTLDLLGGYNKASVKTSNYNITNVFPEENYDKLDTLFHLVSAFKRQSDGKRYHDNKYYLKSELYKMYNYMDSINMERLTEDQVKEYYKKEPYKMLGGCVAKRCCYEIILDENGTPIPQIANYDWENVIQVKRMGDTKKDDGYHVSLPINAMAFTFKKKLPAMIFSEDGAIAISCMMQLCGHSDMGYYSDKYYTNIGDKDPDQYNTIACKLYINDLYYNGSSWIKDSNATFNIEFSIKDALSGGFVQIRNTKTLDMPYNDLNGYVIELPKGVIAGSINFEMGRLILGNIGYTVYGYFIKNLKLDYKLRDTSEGKVNLDTDRIYENVVNEDYINELDEIEFKISTYNNDGICYGKVLFDNDYLRDNLYCILEDSTIRLEELLIKRIVRQYQATKMKLNQVLIYNNEISPLTEMKDNYMNNKIFSITGGEIDFANESFAVNMLENDKYN